MNRMWKIVIGALVCTPVLLLIGLKSAGAGHGHYLMAKLLFPYTMLSTVVFGRICGWFLGLAVLQYPVYGAWIGMASERGALWKGIAIVVATHLMAVGLCALFVGKEFS